MTSGIGTQIRNAIVEVRVNDNPSCTGWFFSEHMPYVLTVGHAFDNKNQKVDIVYNGDEFIAEILECQSNKNNRYDLDFAILFVIGIERYSVLNTSFTSKGDYHLPFLSYGFPKRTYGKTPLLGEIQGQVHRNDDKNNPLAPLYLLKTDKNIKLNGNSGAPICIKKGKRWIAIGIFNLQYQKELEGTRLAYALALSKLTETQIILKILTETENIHKQHNIFGFPQNNTIRLDRIGLMVKPYSIDNLEGFKKFEKIESDWKKIEKTVLKKIKEIIPSFSRKNLIHFRSFPTNYGNIKYLKKDPLYYERDYPVTRVVLDFSDKFDFNEHISSTYSHLVGIRFAKEMELNSTEMYNLIISIKVSDDFGTIKKSLFHILEDILMDINLFYSIPTLTYLFNSAMLKKEFNSYKIDFAMKNGLSSYGLLLNKNVGYISMSSLLRTSVEDVMDNKKLETLWIEFVTDYLPRNLDLKTVLGQVSSKLSYSSFSKPKDIIESITRLKKTGYQFSTKRLMARLEKFSNHSLIIFAYINSKPNRKSQERSLEALFPTTTISNKTFQFFELKQIKQVLASSDFLSITIFRKGTK